MLLTRLPIIDFPVSMFTRFTKTDDNRSMLVCEASDMGNRHLQPLFDESCDVGFAVKMEDGELLKLSVDEVCKDAEGEITHWHYTVIDVVDNKDKYLDITAMIFND